MKIHTYSTAVKTAHALCERLKELMLQKNGNAFHLAISGGSTAVPFFEALAGKYRKEINWEQLRLYWVDERCVPPADPESNYGQAKLFLLDKVPLAVSSIHYIRGEEDPFTESNHYSALVTHEVPLSKGYPAFDLCLLGVGKDGHISSIFPDNRDLLDCEQIYAASVHPETGQERVALTGRSILHARNIIFYITGLEKTDIVKKLMIDNDPDDIYPAKYIIRHAPQAEFFIDKDAALELKITEHDIE